MNTLARPLAEPGLLGWRIAGHAPAEQVRRYGGTASIVGVAADADAAVPCVCRRPPTAVAQACRESAP
ncbi:MAG: hypothetical protein QM581_12450 [Pseudomonas sp.]